MTNISRRTLLNRTLLLMAAGGGAAIGLTKTVHHKVAVPPAAPPAALTTALDTQKRLLGGYDAAIAASPNLPALTAMRADVDAHGAALRAVLETYPGWRYAQSRTSAAVSPSTPPAVAGTRAALARASKVAADAAGKACLDWPAGEQQAAQVVPLLGSIAACLSTHAGVLA